MIRLLIRLQDHDFLQNNYQPSRWHFSFLTRLWLHFSLFDELVSRSTRKDYDSTLRDREGAGRLILFLNWNRKATFGSFYAYIPFLKYIFPTFHTRWKNLVFDPTYPELWMDDRIVGSDLRPYNNIRICLFISTYIYQTEFRIWSYLYSTTRWPDKHGRVVLIPCKK